MRVWTNEGGKGRFLDVDGKIFKYKLSGTTYFCVLTDENDTNKNVSDDVLAICKAVYPKKHEGVNMVFREKNVIKKYNVTNVRQLESQYSEEFI